MQESSAALRAQVGELRYDCSGRLQYQEDILNGIEQASVAIAGLYRGAKFGKRLIHPYCAVVVAISSEGSCLGYTAYAIHRLSAQPK